MKIKLNKYTKAIWLIANFSLLIVLSGCAELFQGKVDMQSLQSDSLSRLVGTDETGKLDAPTGFYATKGNAPTAISLSWEKVTGAVSYLIEYAEDKRDEKGDYAVDINMRPYDTKDLEWNVLENTVYGNSYTHNILNTIQSSSEEYTKRFFYRVYAKNERNKRDESDASNVDYGVLFSTPLGVEASKGDDLNNITVKWQKVENARYYDIYRSRNPDGSSAVKIAERAANLPSYIDKVQSDERGVEFSYVVYARNSGGVQSAPSSPALGFARKIGAPAQPTDVVAARGVDPAAGITVTWEGSAERYNVYRSSSVDSALTLLGTVASKTFTDKRALKPGIYYYYQIQAESGTGDDIKRSQFSETDRGDISHKSVGFIISSPTTIDVEKDGDNVVLRWLPAIGTATEQKDYTYKIYYDATKDGTFLNSVGSDVSGSTVDSNSGYITHTIKNHTGGNYLKITTTWNSKTSDKSAVVAPAPLAAVSVVATKAANPSNWGGGSAPSNASSSGIYPVRVTWNKPPNDNPAGYHVYRSLHPVTGYRKITESPVTGTSYVDSDETMKVGKYYYYKVLALNDLWQGKNYSSYHIGYGALTAEQFLKECNKQIKSSQKKMTYMHKGGTAALGNETKNGNITGTLSYSATLDGLGARIIMPYSNYCDALIDNYYVHTNGDTNDSANYVLADAKERRYMIFDGNTNTSANMSSNGTMDGTVTVTGMYKGSVVFNYIQVKGGNAGGGHYPVTVEGFGSRNIAYNVIN